MTGNCEVCGIKTDSQIGITYGNKTVVLCGGHELKDLRAMNTEAKEAKK